MRVNIRTALKTSPLDAIKLELKLEKKQMTQKPMLRADLYARALCASQNVKRAKVWICARCALWVGGAWASVEWKALVWGGANSAVEILIT
jgi:hypothetical protein